jgi:NADH-quinone oxidoreductase subunit C
MNAKEPAANLLARFTGRLTGPVEFRGEQTLTLIDPAQIVAVCHFAKTDLGFDLLLDISSIDEYDREPRWTVVYELAGTTHRNHLRLKTQLAGDPAELPTVSGVWRTADWHEREIYDLMGIRFAGHPDLRRILMWEGYPYHPLRKDFPLAGKPSEALDLAFSQPAPLEGGPFVAAPGAQTAVAREPRARGAES